MGVRGARISSGPRGTYVHLGLGGFRYTQRLDAQTSSSRPETPPEPSPRPLAGAGRKVENVEPSQIQESSADALLDEIRTKHAKVSVVGVSVIAGITGLSLFALTVQAEGPPAARWGSLAFGIVALASIPWSARWDRRSRTVHIHYVLDTLGERVNEGIERLLSAFQRTHAVWSVHTEHVHGDWKRNAGAETSVDRRRVQVGWGAPSLIETNARVGFLNVEGTHLYFFPDRLLIFGRGGVRAVPYLDLRIEAGQVRFIEDGGVPRDARVLGMTWRYVNKDGGPDRRFANNSQLPVVLYGTLSLSSPTGLRMSLQTSSEALASGAHDMLRLIQAGIRALQSRAALSPLSTAFPSLDDDPPPLFELASALVRSTLNFLSFRWVSDLPEWGVPIAWGLVFSLPMVGLLVRIAGPHGLATNLFLCGTLLVGGCGVAALAGEQLRSRRARRNEEAAERRSRFRAMLMSELRNRPAAQVDFSALVADGDLPRDEADQVADEVFRRMADRFVEDGVITRVERTKLDRLARALEIDSDCAAQLLEEAKSERYSTSVTEP